MDRPGAYIEVNVDQCVHSGEALVDRRHLHDVHDIASGVVELRGSWCDRLNDGSEHNVWFENRGN